MRPRGPLLAMLLCAILAWTAARAAALNEAPGPESSGNHPTTSSGIQVRAAAVRRGGSDRYGVVGNTRSAHLEPVKVLRVGDSDLAACRTRVVLSGTAPANGRDRGPNAPIVGGRAGRRGTEAVINGTTMFLRP